MTTTVYGVYTINKEYNFRDFVFNGNTQNTLEEIYKETTLDLDSSFCLKTFAELEMAKQYLHNKFSEVYDTNGMEISVAYLASVTHEDTENIEYNIIEYAKFCDRGIYKLKKYFDTYSGNEKYNIFKDNNKAINLTVEDNCGVIYYRTFDKTPKQMEELFNIVSELNNNELIKNIVDEDTNYFDTDEAEYTDDIMIYAEEFWKDKYDTITIYTDGEIKNEERYNKLKAISKEVM